MLPSHGVFEFDPASTCNLELGEHNLCAFLDYRVLLDAEAGLVLGDFALRKHLFVSFIPCFLHLLLFDVLTIVACMIPRRCLHFQVTRIQSVDLQTFHLFSFN